MRGCGKTQLASALAQECEDANWSIVAWVNAGSPESITNDLVELAKKLEINMSDQPTPKTIIRRCFDQLESEAPSDRLIVFDNVEDINDLRNLVPNADGLRVVATTTNNIGWNDQGWDTIKVGVFDRDKSIYYLLTVTKSDDHDAADALAQRLGDLPLALAQAAATARNSILSLTQYLDRLDSYRSERVIRPVPGDYYTEDAATALCMAIEEALENLEDGTKQAALRQLGALALLAESGVPTHWLDPSNEQRDEREVHGTNRADGDITHDALTELIHRSIVHQSADKSKRVTAIHRLQAEVWRDSWNESDRTDAFESAAALLTQVDIDSFPRNDVASRRSETLDLIEQLSSIGKQEHSRQLLRYEQIKKATFHSFLHADNLGLSFEAIVLKTTVKTLQHVMGPDHPDTLILRSNLACAYVSVGRLAEAIALFEQVLTDSIRILGNDHPNTLTSRNNLAYAYASAGRLAEAITVYEQVLTDRTRILGEDHPDTLNSRNNLAGAYESAGRLAEAITLYEQVLTDRIRILGEDHPNTLSSRNNLAGAYQRSGRLDEAIQLFEQTLHDCIRVLGKAHPFTATVRENLEATKRELEQQEEDSAAE